ncbi:uncharacterized protein LOC144350877 [Saccoglossus kowalevskii]
MPRVSKIFHGERKRQRYESSANSITPTSDCAQNAVETAMTSVGDSYPSVARDCMRSYLPGNVVEKYERVDTKSSVLHCQQCQSDNGRYTAFFMYSALVTLLYM